jgi:hypothetical protein
MAKTITNITTTEVILIEMLKILAFKTDKSLAFSFEILN